MKSYICSTPYHLFLSLCKILDDNEKSFIYLTTPDENVFKLFKTYKEKIERLESVDRVYLRKRSNLKERIYIETIFDYYEYKKLKPYIEKSRVYIFPWNPYTLYSTSEYIFKKSKEVILVEDGANAYLRERSSQLNTFIKKYIYRRNTEFYKENKIKKILVQFPEKYPRHLEAKIKKIELDTIFKKMDSSTIKSMMNIFDSNIDINLFNVPTIAILTQPLSEDGYISEKEKINIFKNLIDKYIAQYNIILKKHPREKTIYNFENVKEIEGSFPSELFALLDIEFEKAIGVCTSAVNSIKAKESFNTDEEFFKKYKNKIL